MRSVEEHRAAVAALIPTARVIDVPAERSAGRVIAREVSAPISLPPFTNSAMDGYAVRASDAAVGATLSVTADIPAGSAGALPLEPGTAHRIMTGAPVPVGADAIAPVETVTIDGNAVRINVAPEAGRFFRRRGDDIAAGQVAFTTGERITPSGVGLAAALGLTTLPVFAPLRIAVLSTGSELVPPGAPLGPGQIYESNAPMLAAAIVESGAEAEVLRFVADDAATFLRALTERLAMGGIDLVVTSGGVSAGAYEVVKDALRDRGVDFVKVAMQPGMPQGSGTVTLPGAPAVGFVTLPGNPVSALVSFEIFVREPLRAAMGLPAERRRRRARLAEAIESIPGKRQYLRGLSERNTDGSDSVSVHGGAASHYLRWLSQANCLIDIPPEVEQAAAGSLVEVIDLTN